jgi:hypothetical protein
MFSLQMTLRQNSLIELDIELNGSELESASNRNEHYEISRGVKVAGMWG